MSILYSEEEKYFELHNYFYRQESTETKINNYLKKKTQLSKFKIEKEKNNLSYSNSIISIFDSFKNEDSDMILKEKGNNYSEQYFVDISDSSQNNKKNIFKVIYPKNFFIFSNLGKNINIELTTSDKYKYKIHPKNRQPRCIYKDDIRKIIKRRFLHTHLKKALNCKLKEAGYKKLLQNFSQSFAGTVSIEKEKKIINQTLFEMFENKELYMPRVPSSLKGKTFENKLIEKNLLKYENNLELVNQIKKDNNPELNIIFNKSYSDLFGEYINSKEFIEEVERLKKSKIKKKSFKKSGIEKIPKENYIEKYIYLAKHFIEFCSQ